MRAKRRVGCRGAGFLGSALAARLRAAGHRVVCLDDFSTGTMAAIAPLMACPADPTWWSRDPAFVATTAFVGTARLLGLAARCGARFVQASTREVYGDPELHPQPEDDPGRVDCTGPRACYEEGKRAAEALCADARRAGQDVRVTRLFNAYGPGMRPDDGRVTPAFISAAQAGRPLVVFGDGSQTRSFCFVDDMLDGMLALMACRTAPDGPVNLGADEEVSMAALARLVLRLCASPAPIHRAPGRAQDRRRRRPDLTRARTLLGFSPRIGLTEGLGRMLAARSVLAPPAPALS